MLKMLFVFRVLKVRPALKALKLKVYMSTLCKSLSENKNGSAGRYSEAKLYFRFSMHLPSRNAKSRGQKGFFLRIFDIFIFCTTPIQS